MANLILRFVVSKGEVDLVAISNGIIGGLVAISAGAPVFEAWVAPIAGGAAAGTIFFFTTLLRLLRIDDVTDAFAVHGGCGMLGVLLVGFLAKKDYMYMVGARAVRVPVLLSERNHPLSLLQLTGYTDSYYGAFYPKSTGKLLLAQLVEIGTIAGTAGGASLILFGVLRLARLARAGTSPASWFQRRVRPAKKAAEEGGEQQQEEEEAGDPERANGSANGWDAKANGSYAEEGNNPVVEETKVEPVANDEW